MALAIPKYFQVYVQNMCKAMLMYAQTQVTVNWHCKLK